ncbi:beta-lactamase/transpeptidase-like protein [Podospora fimiseda]|uniref:Beta-lactamase/transpeptidase-like protein n=1 Tax=Podospora fimiseda TaxID=252190 RepID=A0AAN7GTF3_9PEZI|nr:beta-lactamase/transpeptidase-like protein [Podospora fimiseda]
MHLSLKHTLAFLAAQSLRTPGVLCDFAGPSFPPPKDLSGNQSLVRIAWNGLKDALQATGLGDHTTTNNCSPANGSTLPETTKNITFSIGLFSLHDPNAVSLQFHHTSPEIAASIYGTKKADGNSIYRVASVTKLFTVFAGLLKLSDTDWERPLSNILTSLSRKGDNTGVLTTPWHKITMRALAAQIAGVPRDGFPVGPGEIAQQMAQNNQSEADLMAESGLPPSNLIDPLSLPPCLLSLDPERECVAETPYIEGVANRAPTFLPWTSPGYANNGFVLLGRAMSNVTGQTIGQLYQENIFTPLGMESTFSDPPPTAEFSHSVIIDDVMTGSFNTSNFIFGSSGGVFSTTEDLARFGTGILNSTLLPAEKTRRWLKPVSHTARLQYDVGAPWEIMRYVSPAGKVTDLYTKLGDSGMYSAWLILVPDYGFGFSILAAGSDPTRWGVVAALADTLTNTLLPSLEQQAAVEAAENFAGIYKTASDSGINSTLVLTAEYDASTAPSLVISSWVSNGTDVFPYWKRKMGSGPFRLLPSINNSSDGKMAFRIVGSADAITPEMTTGALFSGPGMLSADWLIVDASTYYGIGLSLFVFDIDSEGKSTAVTPAAYRTTMIRTAE